MPARSGAGARAGAILAAEAEAGRLRGPLHGIPVAVKDVIDVAGLPTRAGSATRAHIPPSTIDAHVVTLLRTAGAVILGKAHTTEFAYFDGPPPTRNPHNVGHTPGGSSAGPAAVVAAGMVPLGLGTQTAGSVNRPAAYCGIAAFKPSTRAWSRSASCRLRRASIRSASSAIASPTRSRRRACSCRRICAIGRVLPALAAHRRLYRRSDPLSRERRSRRHAARGCGQAQRIRRSRQINACQPVPFADIIGWHKTMIEYEVARAHPSLEHAAEASAGLREAVGRGRMIGDQSYVDACRALDAVRERFRAATAEVPGADLSNRSGRGAGRHEDRRPRFIVPFTALGGPIVSIPVGIGAHGLPLGLMLIGAPGQDAAIADDGGRDRKSHRAAALKVCVLVHAGSARSLRLKHRRLHCTVTVSRRKTLARSRSASSVARRASNFHRVIDDRVKREIELLWDFAFPTALPDVRG